MNYSTETLDRIRKLERIKTLGVNPYATKFDITHQIGQIVSSFAKELATTKEETEDFVSETKIPPTPLCKGGLRTIEDIIPAPMSEVALAGRVMLHRSFGKICFATLGDGTGRIQILFSRENCSINVDGEKKTELTGEAEPVTAYKFAEKLIDLGDFIGVK